mmetsp:Transcript_3048/g.8831  ORF Transcript_3048/g.8831 Transcript_3048/m.8831 type:complete len:98 (+) Transcript_3048:84-377(+)
MFGPDVVHEKWELFFVTATIIGCVFLTRVLSAVSCIFGPRPLLEIDARKHMAQLDMLSEVDEAGVAQRFKRAGVLRRIALALARRSALCSERSSVHI